MESLEPRRLFSAALGVAAAVGALSPGAVGVSQSSQKASLSVTMGSQGIEKLSYGSTVLFDATVHPLDTFGVFEYSETVGGTTTNYTSGIHDTTSWNAKTSTLTLAFSWGTVAVTYTISGNNISMAIVVHNTTANATINGVNIAPLTLYFPQMPVGFAGQPQVNFGTDTPGVMVADFGTGAVAMVQENPTAPLYSGFLAHNIFELGYEPWIGSAPLPGMPTSWPALNQPIAPGASSTYNIALRFGPTGSTPTTLAPDVLSAYAAANPDTVNWSNRNPIGMLFPAGCAPTNYSATNPRGWFNDPTVNVFTQAGLQAFSQRLLAYAASAISILKAEGAQGMITWDIEGEQYPTATYVGDPRLATTLAPELAYNNTVGQYFQLFRNAGLETGVTIRPQQIVFVNGVPVQETITNPTVEVQTLVSKIQYAESNWGCTLFYIDSTAWEESPSVLEQVHEQCPNVLLIPENTNTGMYSATAPFGQIRTSPVTMPVTTTQLYPNAFMAIDTTVAQPGVMTETQLVNDVKAGDILMFEGSWNEPCNALVKEAYATVAAQNASSKTSSSTQKASTSTTKSVGISQESSSPIADLLSSGSNAISDLLQTAKSGLAN